MFKRVRSKKVNIHRKHDHQKKLKSDMSLDKPTSAPLELISLQKQWETIQNSFPLGIDRIVMSYISQFHRVICQACFREQMFYNGVFLCYFCSARYFSFPQ